MPSYRLALEQAKQLILRERRRLVRSGDCDVARERLEERRPAAARFADDLVIGALAADVLVGRNRRKDRDACGVGEGLRLPCSVVLVDDQSADAYVAAELAEIFDRGTDVVGDVERLEVVRSNDDHFLAHVAS